MSHYILDAAGNSVLEDDLFKWAIWFSEANRHGLRAVVRTDLGWCKISTVFLAIDHRFHGEGPPLLWETAVFGLERDDPDGGVRKRYAFKAEAIIGHDEVVAAMRLRRRREKQE